jgi:surface polysaccharide O-acyltransferase-like enzyme
MSIFSWAAIALLIYTAFVAFYAVFHKPRLRLGPTSNRFLYYSMIIATALALVMMALHVLWGR